MFSGFCDINVNITLNIFSLENHVDPDSMPTEYIHPVLCLWLCQHSEIDTSCLLIAPGIAQNLNIATKTCHGNT